MSTEFIELAGKINQQMPYHCVERIERALNDVAKPVRGSQIAILGVSYKGGVGDIRESPALRIMEVLARARRGARLPRPVRARRCPSSGFRASPLEDGGSPRPTPSCSSPPIPDIDYAQRRLAQRRCSSTSAGSPGGCRSRTSCGSDSRCPGCGAPGSRIVYQFSRSC